jgi:hypothetical protein
MRRASVVLMWAGAVVAGVASFLWVNEGRGMEYRFPLLLWLMPAYTAVVMGWQGVLATRGESGRADGR